MLADALMKHVAPRVLADVGDVVAEVEIDLVTTAKGDVVTFNAMLEDVTFNRASARDIAFVFQLFALYPHLTAYENIAFPLRATRESRASVDAQVRQVARSLQVEHLLNRRPAH